MADDNDKPTLTRRRVLGGLATVGVAGAAGAGAWAGFSDSEMVTFEAHAGTLDLAYSVSQGDTIDGNNYSEKQNENTLTLTVDEMAPGDVFSKNIRIFNLGSVKAHAASIQLKNINSTEGDNPPSETNTGGDGELDDQLEIRCRYYNGSELQIYGQTKPDWGTDKFISLTEAANKGEVVNPGILLPYSPTGDNDYDSFTVWLRFPDLDPSKNNKAMGDTVSFDLEFTLYQNKHPFSGGGSSGSNSSSP